MHYMISWMIRAFWLGLWEDRHIDDVNTTYHILLLYHINIAVGTYSNTSQNTDHPPPVTTWISSVRLLLFLLPCSTFFNVTFSLKQRRLYLQLTSEESKQFRNNFYFCTTRSFTYKNYRVAQILYGNGKTRGVTYMATVISLTHLLFISSVLVDM